MWWIIKIHSINLSQDMWGLRRCWCPAMWCEFQLHGQPRLRLLRRWTRHSTWGPTYGMQSRPFLNQFQYQWHNAKVFIPLPSISSNIIQDGQNFTNRLSTWPLMMPWPSCSTRSTSLNSLMAPTATPTVAQSEERNLEDHLFSVWAHSQGGELRN